MTAPFISSADLAAYTVNDSLNSDLAVIALDAACESVRGHVDQALELTSVTDEWRDGNGTGSMLLPFPLTALTSLVVYADRTDTAPDTLVANTDYVVNLTTGVVNRIDGGRFTLGRQNVKVSYSFGYVTVPSDARLVALQVAARIYEIGMVENESVGGVSQAYVKGAGQLTLDEKHALRRHRKGW